MGKLIDKALIQAEIMSDENINRLFKNRETMNTQNRKFSEDFFELARHHSYADKILHMANQGCNPYAMIEEMTKHYVDIQKQNFDILHQRNQFAPPPPMEVPYSSLPKELKEQINVKKDFEKSVLFKVYKFFKK